MQNNINEENNRQEFLFQHLVAMFQTLALQQLGKLINPMTGKTERDLNQARITIDMLNMIREKTRGNLNSTEEQVLDKVMVELQMNYVTEKDKGEEEPEPGSGEKESAENLSGEGEAGDGSNGEDDEAERNDEEKQE